jgi:DNA-directed RNA polymerase subunit H (RpoH/RPB5)
MSGRKAPKKKSKATSAEGEEPQTLHYEFDPEFLGEYKVMLTMLLERGYDGDGLIGVEAVPPDHEPSDDDLDDGIVGSWSVAKASSVATGDELTERYGGLENFSLSLRHQDARLNMLVYYLIPEVESHGSTQERKQLSERQVKTVIGTFEATPSVGRLLLISKVKPSADAMAQISRANIELADEVKRPLLLVKLVQTSFFQSNPMRWILQPKNVRVLFGEEKAQLLEELSVAEHLRGKEEGLIPQMSEIDPLAVYYGARVGDLVTFIRTVPASIFFMRIIIYDLEAQ